MRKAAIMAIHVKDEVFRGAASTFDSLVKACEDGTETFALVLRAPSGAGKSHILDHLRSDPRLVDFADEHGACRPLVYVRAPSPCTLKTLGLGILQAMTGTMLSANLKEHDIWVRARTMLVNLGVSILMIDELHHVFEGKTAGEHEKLLSTLKALILGIEDQGTVETLGALPPTVVPVPMGLVLAGMPTLRKLIATDIQLQRRCRFRSIERTGTTDAEENKLRSFISSYEKKIGLKTTPALTDPDMLLRLRRGGGHLRGRVAYLIKEASYLAIDEGTPAVDRVKHFARVFEETYELGAARNPFLIADIKKLGPIKEVERDTLTLLRGAKEPEQADDVA